MDMTVARKRGLIAAGVVVALVIVAYGLAGRGSVETAGASASWAKPCRERPARTDRKLVAACARLHGRVLWVRRQGLGASSKAEFIVLAGFRPYVVKLSPVAADRRLPGIGHDVTVIGPMVASRSGLREVQDFAEE